MGSIVAEIADKIAGAGDGERSEFEVRGGVGADGGGILTLSTSELTVVDGDKLGRIDFQAPLETGTDAIVVAASIYAEADDTFAADNNSTELVFAVGASEAAVEKMRLDHDGQLGIGTATPASKLHVEGAVQVGVDDAGHDFTLFGHAAGAALIWDASADVLIVRGATADHATTSAGRILLQTNQTAVVDNDRIGQIDFSSPAETGSDALLVSASIYAEAEDTFDATGNETALVFATGSSELAAEKVRITNAGNVGIGTAAPETFLHVGDSAGGSAGVVGPKMMLANVLATEYDATSSNTWHGIKTTNADGTSTRTATGLIFEHRTSSSGVAAIVSTSAAADRGDIRFITRGSAGISQKMHLDNNGLLGIGVNDPGTLIDVNSGSNAGIRTKSTSSTEKNYIGLNTGGSESFHVKENGNAFAGNNLQLGGELSEDSDERLKENIKPLTGALDKVNQMRGVHYNRKKHSNLADADTKTLQVGLLAQELEKITPELVKTSSENDDWTGLKDKKTVNYPKLTGYLIEAVKELSAEVDKLKE